MALESTAGVPLRPRLTGRGALVLLLGVVVLAAGVVLGYAGVVVLGAGLVLLVAAAVVAVVLPAPVEPQRRVTPVRVVRNGRCTSTLRVRSAGSRFAVTLDAQERIGTQRLPVSLPRLRPGQVIEVSLDIPTTRRGRVDVGPLRLRRVGTAGLAVATGEVGEIVPVHVLPRVLPVHGVPAGVRRGHVGADERIERGGTDLVGMREYVPGDDLRRVHGPTSARVGTLMVREDADPARPRLTVLIDDAAGSYAGDQFEDAVEIAASLVAELVDHGHAVRLLSTSGGIDDEIDAAPTGMTAPGAGRLLAALAEAVPDDGAPAPAPLRGLDVAVAVTGTGGDAAGVAALAARISRAAFPVLAVVDERAARVEVLGEVLVLRAPTAEDVLLAWDQAVG